MELNINLKLTIFQTDIVWLNINRQETDFMIVDEGYQSVQVMVAYNKVLGTLWLFFSWANVRLHFSIHVYAINATK